VPEARRGAAGAEWILLLQPSAMLELDDLAAPELKLAGVRFNPDAGVPSRRIGYSSITLLHRASKEKRVLAPSRARGCHPCRGGASVTFRGPGAPPHPRPSAESCLPADEPSPRPPPPRPSAPQRAPVRESGVVGVGAVGGREVSHAVGAAPQEVTGAPGGRIFSVRWTPRGDRAVRRPHGCACHRGPHGCASTSFPSPPPLRAARGA